MDRRALLCGSRERGSAVSFVGPVSIDVEGDSRVARHVRDELSNPDPRPDPTATSIELGVHQEGVGSRLSQAARTIRDSRAPYRFRAAVFEDQFELAIGLKTPPFWLYSVRVKGDLLGDGAVVADVHLPKLGLASAVARPFLALFGRDGLSLSELMAKNVLYEIVDPLVWTRMLGAGSALVHASAIAMGDEGILFSGSGGVGKSSALLALMQHRPDVRYLSDDLAILLPGGELERHPKRLQIYEYNLRDAPGVRDRLDELSSVSGRMWWRIKVRLLGSRRVRRRVSAASLFGEGRVADRAKLSKAVWILPSGDSEPRWAPLSAAGFAELATSAILSEFWDFLRLLNGVTLAGAEIEPVTALAARSRALIEKSLAGVECRTLHVPAGFGGESLAVFLESSIL